MKAVIISFSMSWRVIESCINHGHRVPRPIPHYDLVARRRTHGRCVSLTLTRACRSSSPSIQVSRQGLRKPPFVGKHEVRKVSSVPARSKAAHTRTSLARRGAGLGLISLHTDEFGSLEPEPSATREPDSYAYGPPKT